MLNFRYILARRSLKLWVLVSDIIVLSFADAPDLALADALALAAAFAVDSLIMSGR